MKTAKRRFGALALLALCSGLAIAEIVEEQAAPAIDANEYQYLMSRSCNDLQALAQRLEEAQYTYLPILPPDSDFSINAQGWLTPFNFNSLPEGFNIQLLIPEQWQGVAVYPLTIAQDPATRDTVFLNSQGDVLYTMPPAAGYDPVAWLLAWRPNLASSLAAAASTNAWLSLNDPARVQISLQLIALDDVVPYLQAEAQARQDAMAEVALNKPLTAGRTMNTMTYSPPSDLIFQAISMDTNGMNLTVGYPDSLAGHHHFILACSDLLTTNWVVAGNDLDIFGQNPYIWTDATLTNVDQRFYRALAVDPLADGDNNGLPDWWELKYFGSLTGAEANGDANSNSVSNLSEYLLGHNPLEVVAPDPNAALALQIYTPLYQPPQ